MRPADLIVGPFRERDSVRISATVVDNAVPPAPIPGSALLTATLTLYSEQFITDSDGAVTYPIINGRDHSDIKSAIDANGALAVILGPNDMAMVDLNDSPMEYHRALIEWTWPTAQRGSYELRIVVRDVEKVPAS